ncbi:MAG: gephyrin-like molybdotransferase Glp [Pseudomonadota bacterium]
MKDLADDCFVHDKDRMKHSEAIDILRQRMTPIVGTEKLSLTQASGRVLASKIVAPRNIPAFDNTAVDGYAFAHSDHEPTGGFFPLTTRIAAGQVQDVELPGFSAARIFTGARMPAGADTVAMQEDCEIHEQDGTSFVIIPAGLKQGANCRLAGEDVKIGESVVSAGKSLRPQDIAAIASTGTSELLAYKPLRVGLLSSGDEILRPGMPYNDGKVYDANFFMLQALLESPVFEVSDLGICLDDAEKLEILLLAEASNHDVIISTGGASKGEEDHFVRALDTLGKCHLWQLAVKPGRPMSFGQIGKTPCFTLPGNPVAAFVCFLLYVRPSLSVLGGGSWREPQRFPLPAKFSIKSKPDRREFLRGFIGHDEQGQPFVKKFERDGSGLISGLCAAEGLIEIAEDQTEVVEGDIVNFIPFAEFRITQTG